MGALYRRQGRWREALANFRRAQELDPRVPHEDGAQPQPRCAIGLLPRFYTAICWRLTRTTSISR
jgi:hypothetical protein